MLKSLYPGVDWDAIKVVGFDLDGTLYDEFDFIRQAYRAIAARLAAELRQPPDQLYVSLLDRWLEKGSSYPRIFEEVLAGSGIEPSRLRCVVEECVELFRATEPNLTLAPRVAHLLGTFAARYELFLVSDGQARLQRAKLTALALERWFQPGNVAISGEYGADFRKPSTRMTDKVDALRNHLASTVVYFGDRAVDQEFAAHAGFHFIAVQCLIPAPLPAPAK